MAGFTFTAKTNPETDSRHDVVSHHMPARAFFFVIVDEVGKEGIVTRKIYTSSTSPYLAKMGLNPLSQMKELMPEKFGLSPKGWGSATSVAEHVMGNNLSSFISASSVFPGGSPRFIGREIYIDIAKAEAAGARIVSTQEIIRSLQEYKTLHPHLAKRVDKIAKYVEEIDKEVLVHHENIPAKAIFNSESLALAKGFSRAGRVVQVIGLVLTAYDLEQASDKSFKAKSVKPISAEVIRQAGGWGGAMAGFKLGGAAGAALGVETGPGAVITGLVGGIIVGTAGYFGADWVADHIDRN